MLLPPLGPGYGFHAGAPGAPPSADRRRDPGYGFFDDAPARRRARHGAEQPAAAPATRPMPRRAGRARRGRRPAAAAASRRRTLRVSVEKVDQLINLVGELVITQAMLAQNSTRHRRRAVTSSWPPAWPTWTATRATCRKSVMSIRMIPMSIVFNRFPRMLRDLAAKLGKKVELVTQGEATELDKGLVEKITDPLTHLVRNSCDHGIEMPAERARQGQARDTARITLVGLAPGRQHRDRGARRRPRPESRAKLLRQGARARHRRARHA